MPNIDDTIPIFVQAPMDTRPRLQVPPEPSYYRRIDGVACLILFFCWLTIGVALLAGVVGALWIIGSNPDDPGPRLLVAALSVVGPVVVTALSLLSMIITAWLLRLAVDVARNLRAIRYGR